MIFAPNKRKVILHKVVIPHRLITQPQTLGQTKEIMGKISMGK